MIGLDGRPLRPIAVLPPEVVAAVRAGRSVDLSQLQLFGQGAISLSTQPLIGAPLGVPGILPLTRPLGVPGMFPFARPMMNSTQVEALCYDQVKNHSAELKPEVQELADTIHLNRFDSRLLDQMLRTRPDTFYDDIEALYKILRESKKPASLLTVCIKWMREGAFNGTKTPNKGVDKAAEKYGLDTDAAFGLADCLERRDDPVEDLRKIVTHLDKSNKPSAMAMKMLKDLRDGNSIEECTHAPSVGSYAYKEEMKRASHRSKSRGRDRRERDKSERRQRERSKSRRGSSRDRRGSRRDKSRSRSRSHRRR